MEKSPLRVTSIRTACLTALFLSCLFSSVLSAVPSFAKQTCKDSILSSFPDSRFILDKEGTALDKTTGLMWMRCSLGQRWDGKTCQDQAASFTWRMGLQAAAKQEFAGHGDWRVPNKNELESIVEESCVSPAIDIDAFPATPAEYYWSASPYAGITNGAWSLDFGYGAVNPSARSGSLHIRLVRDPE